MKWEYTLYELVPKISAVDIGMGARPSEFTLKKIGSSGPSEDWVLFYIPRGSQKKYVVLKEFSRSDEDDD